MAAEMVPDRACNIQLGSRNGCLSEVGQDTLKQRKRQNKVCHGERTHHLELYVLLEN